MSIRLYFFLALISMVIVDTCSAQTCSCTPTPDTKTVYNNSSVVFVGQVEKVEHSNYRPGYNQITFRSLSVLKGEEEVLQDHLVIYTKSSEQECGYPFYLGLDYVVYATGIPAFYQTDKCTRNILLDKALEELGHLKEIIKQK